MLARSRKSQGEIQLPLVQNEMPVLSWSGFSAAAMVLNAENPQKVLLGHQEPLILSPLSLPRGLAGFCTNKNEPAFSGAKAVKPPPQGRGRLNQQSVRSPGEDCIVPSGARKRSRTNSAHTSINRWRRILTAIRMQKPKVTAFVSLSCLIEIQLTITSTELRVWCNPLRAA